MQFQFGSGHRILPAIVPNHLYVHKKSYLSAPLALAMPLYWVLISIAAWRGLLQLITKLFYWEKTLHGVSKSVSYEKPLLN
jgi:hypothetical protein